MLRGSFQRERTHTSTNAGFFAAFGFGFDVYRTEVSASVPLMIGDMIGLSSRTDLELAARVTPLFYFGERPGISYGATVGIRYTTLSE